ncbi:hypothetical protein T459_04264 [Capsicum annuum]|uniref:RNA-dependent RNA polymerase n=1 Tax=Capsicum annuum TaxID=4072 RepID=A0A2G3A4N7_CAPAN|nr:hypothetical protein T459_04264 [Capsicum annuum]
MLYSSVKPSLKNCFVKNSPEVSDIMKKLQVIKGLVIIAKNPSSSWDVRILEAFDVPGLHHLYDYLVFPQKGDNHIQMKQWGMT